MATAVPAPKPAHSALPMRRTTTGEQTMTDTEALHAIAALMSSVQWDTDMLDTIAEFVRSTGRPILDPPTDFLLA
ncbi:MAG: hypothetical protein ACRDRD_12445 [Pseudonocardiaceae bacterium]